MCNKVNKSDHYYGAFLTKIIDGGKTPVLVDKDSSRGVYKLITDKDEYHVYMKYSTNKKGDKLWNFSFTEDNLKEVKNYIDKGTNLIFGFISSYTNLKDTEIAICDKREFLKCIDFDCRINKSQRISIWKIPNSPYLRLYGTFLDRDKNIEIDRNRIKNL